MPLAPSTTTFSFLPRLTASGSMNFSAAAWNSSWSSTGSTVPGASSPVVAAAPPPSCIASTSLRMSWMPSSPDSASAPSRISFTPV